MSPRSSGGFTLVETLVAVTLLALLFGALMPVFQQGLTVLRVSDRHARAVLLAQSLLDREASTQLHEHEREHESAGEEGGLRWQVSREPYAGDDAGPEILAEGTLALEKVTVTVTWDGNETGVRLATLGVVSRE